uniref:Protein SirB1 N-terminal domain-containing protein n=1 Tax=Amphimedon queenslandica TaxID=400682 RepID=A0A1X7TJF0_AMPQE
GINFILYDKLGFKPAVDDYYHLKNSLINKVLDQRRGIPISLSAVYQSVAHTLGITLLPVNFPAHFLLKYPQNLAKGDSEVFIDAYGRGQLLNQDECLGLIPFLTIPSPDMFNPVDPYKAMIRMVANIYSRSSINFDVGRQWDEEKNQW